MTKCTGNVFWVGTIVGRKPGSCMENNLIKSV
jgi:hypothetical protein